MRHFMMAVFALCLALLLCACATDDATPTGETTELTSVTSDPTIVTAAPTANNAELLLYIQKWETYCQKPFTYIVFNYDPSQEYDYPGKAFDRSSMEKGHYYAVDDGDVYDISDQHIIAQDITSEHIYYVLSNDPSAVYRCTLHGENHVLLYRSEFGSISSIQYSGTDSSGQLFLSEANKTYRFTQYDIPSGSVQLLKDTDQKAGFVYYPHSLDFTAKNLGPVVEIAYQDESSVWNFDLLVIETGECGPVSAFQ